MSQRVVKCITVRQLGKISETKNAVKIPVIANGDIKNSDDAKQALKLSGCDGVMIGHYCLWQAVAYFANCQ